MRARLATDTWVLIVLGLFLAVTAYVASREQRAASMVELRPRRTTYSSRPGGLKALYETLDRLGYPVCRHLAPLTTELPDGVLFIATPEQSVGRNEWRSLREWVERGNLLVVSSDPGDLPVEQQKRTPVGTSPVCPSFLSPHVSAVAMPRQGRITEEAWAFQHGGCFGQPFG